MLPSNPLQHLLSQALARPLVMTSGNLSGRPPALTNAEALADLAGIADGFLLHNREIVQRMDDSVVRQSGEMLRRARGYVPDALALPPGFHDVPPLLALGADMKIRSACCAAMKRCSASILAISMRRASRRSGGKRCV